MTQHKNRELILNKQFDATSCRHKIDGNTMVLHCHHFASLYTQLAQDCSMLDAKSLLTECSEDAWQEILSNSFRSHGAMGIPERISLAEQTYAATGLGKMRVICAGPESGEVTLEHSHVDEGWIKKWGPSHKPVNFIGAGFIAALFSAVFDKGSRSYVATETQSIVGGAKSSLFTVVTR